MPSPTGRDQIADFFASVPAGWRLELIELVVVRANGQPALATYLPDDPGDCRSLRDHGPRYHRRHDQRDYRLSPTRHCSP